MSQISPTALSVARRAAVDLLAYCSRHNWAGYDPYDVLNSRWLQAVPALDSKWPRLVLTQLAKRSPFNLRPVLRVAPSQNPKGLALFLKSVIHLKHLGIVDQENLGGELVGRIAQLRSPEQNRWCWGYSFAWQTRTLLVPRFAPNLVCTVFVAEALLDWYEETAETLALEMAASAAEYITQDLLWTEGDVVSFRYPHPASKSRVHNANLLAAAFLARIAKLCGNNTFAEVGLKAARYSARAQADDGSWLYGEAPTQNWVDNFHTGYNLCALRSLRKHLGTVEFDPYLSRGFNFYRRQFIGNNGAPWYFHNKPWPLDVHSAAQTILTLLEFSEGEIKNLAVAEQVVNWTISNLWDPRGFFYHQKLAIGRIKIPYMRWGQAWMLLALTMFLKKAREPMISSGMSSERRYSPSPAQVIFSRN